MAKIKKTYKEGYTILSNDMYRDKRLQNKDRGLLGTMMSLPENWNFSILGLASIGLDGEASIRNSLKKLEKCGYLKRKRIYENGKVVNWEYNFSSSPAFQEETKNEELNKDIFSEEDLHSILSNAEEDEDAPTC
ncbi:MAG: hypothetical protein WBO70_00420 [Erysipelotrichaceae bacterium]